LSARRTQRDRFAKKSELAKLRRIKNGAAANEFGRRAQLCKTLLASFRRLQVARPRIEIAHHFEVFSAGT
jgi:hypothetical protein